MEVRLPPPRKRTTLANTSAAFEHRRWLQQDRLRGKHFAEETRQEPESYQQCEYIDHRPPEQESEHSPRYPNHQRQDLSG
jgi:hypothetical protein